ncbi:hypothetical protein [Acinetobacter sp. Ac_5812]|uniref:hypothetical protein n=1 Tax=Acinetobacter sp. Ac_5812 TaxID=1848937 RepID=UPI0014901C87|nr:hypothetical protein [Acinetobacter sp. Ac_5812]
MPFVLKFLFLKDFVTDEMNNMLNTVKCLVRPEKERQYLPVKCKKWIRMFG